MQKWMFVCLAYIFCLPAFAQNNWEIYGTVKDSSGIPLEHILINVIDNNSSTVTDHKGFFKFSFQELHDYQLLFSGLNYRNKKVTVKPEMKGIELIVLLEASPIQISEVLISDNKVLQNGLTRIEPKILNSIPSIGGDRVQNIIKTMPGVASVNELSSAYTVRGGNYDENLVYINGIEILRPALLQSGQQEGLNMINADLVSRIEFSSGGFSAVFDDKMSSVLDIKYRQPEKFSAGASISLLGASLFIEGTGLKDKFSHLTGLRYKNAQYLFKTLETSGEYKPNFFDFQSLISYHFSKKFNASIFGYFSDNNYLFFPDDRSTSFGTTAEAIKLYIDFEGKENDRFRSLLGAFTLNFSPAENTMLKISSSLYDNHESLNYDIEGRYSLNQLDKQLGSSSFGDSILNLGIGRFIDHARSYYNARIFSLNHTGWWYQTNNKISWGLKFQKEFFEDQVNEWKMMDSAGYSIPYTNQEIILAERWYSNNLQKTDKISAFINNSYQNPGRRWNLEYGIRYTFSNINQQQLFSPRVSAGWFPLAEKKFFLRAGSGVYYQSLVFREIIDRDGKIYPSTKTPFAIHYTLSGDYDFQLMGRPFHFKAELFYKNLNNLIPYSVENIRNIYYPGKTAKGFAGGIDMRLNGEFVKDTESWLSISLMKSGIKIAGDTIGKQPLPNDHFVNISLYFQDYVPGNERFRMYLALYYVSGRPFGPPNNTAYYAPLRIKDYKRADIGFSVELKQSEGMARRKSSAYFKQVLLNIEIFNLLGISNTISYNWVTVVPNSSVIGSDIYSTFAVPNRLSARRLNLRLLVQF